MPIRNAVGRSQLYQQGNYSEAWVKVKRARELNAKPFPESFITALSQKQPEI